MAKKTAIEKICSLMFLCMFLYVFFSIKVKKKMFFLFFLNLQINVFNIYDGNSETTVLGL